MIYAYGICEPAIARSFPEGRGLGGARLRVLQSDGLAAVYSSHRSLRVQPTREQVLTHEHVVEELMACGPVLPFRFGTEVPDDADLKTVLDERGVELNSTLERVRGRVELGLRVLPDGTDENADQMRTRSGRDALLSRVQEHRRAVGIASELHTPFARLAAASTVQEFPRPPALLVSSYLVDREQVADFRDRADQLATAQDGLRILVTGPWPPYNFVGAEPQ